MPFVGLENTPSNKHQGNEPKYWPAYQLAKGHSDADAPKGTSGPAPQGGCNIFHNLPLTYFNHSVNPYCSVFDKFFKSVNISSERS